MKLVMGNGSPTSECRRCPRTVRQEEKVVDGEGGGVTGENDTKRGRVDPKGKSVSLPGKVDPGSCTHDPLLSFPSLPTLVLLTHF